MCTCSSFPFHQKDNTTRKNKMHVFVCECVFSSFDTEGFASALRKYKWLRFQHVHLRVGHSKIFQGSWSKPLTYLVALCASFRCISRLSALSSSKFYLTGPVLLQLAAALCPGFGNLMNVSIPEMVFWCWLCFNCFFSVLHIHIIRTISFERVLMFILFRVLRSISSWRGANGCGNSCAHDRDSTPKRGMTSTQVFSTAKYGNQSCRYVCILCLVHPCPCWKETLATANSAVSGCLRGCFKCSHRGLGGKLNRVWIQGSVFALTLQSIATQIKWHALRFMSVACRHHLSCDPFALRTGSCTMW